MQLDSDSEKDVAWFSCSLHRPPTAIIYRLDEELDFVAREIRFGSQLSSRAINVSVTGQITNGEANKTNVLRATSHIVLSLDLRLC